jgi:RNA polymerase sigma factor for flagellar operon FliA
MTDYLGLLYRVAKFRAAQLHRAGVHHIELDELVDEGYVGLNKAAETFSEKINPNFDYHAYKLIHFAISQYLRSLDFLPKEKRRSLKLLRKVENEMMQQLGRIPTDEELAEEMDCEIVKVRKIRQSACTTEPVSNKKSGEEGQSAVEVLAAEEEEPSKKLDAQNVADATNECMKQCLNQNQILILLLMDVREFSAREVAELLNDDAFDINAVYYQQKTARMKMASCLKHKGYLASDV